MFYYGQKREPRENYFPVHNRIFDLGLCAEELAIYLYLVRCEDKKTYTCYPSHATIGHESVETTLNVYSHTTDEGMRTAAQRIDRAMGAISGVTDENNGAQGTVEQTPDTRPQKPPREKFEPRKGKYRRQGTGSIHQVSKNVWEGRYSPNINGKRIIRNV